MAEIKTVIRQARLENREALADIGIGSDGRILKIEDTVLAPGAEYIDAAGALASPPFVDPHTHLDKAFFQPAANISGTLDEAIEIMSKHKDLLQAGDDMAKRADTALRLAFTRGTLAVRTHVDIDPVSGARGVEQLLRVKDEWKDRIGLQIVAFPQDGLVGKPQVLKSMREALEMGADAVGGIPGLESGEREAQEHINQIFELASEFGKDVDMHIDESDDPNSHCLEMLAKQTAVSGFIGNVSAAHCCSLSAYDDEYALRVISMVADAKINIITNPTVNLVLQGRHDKQPQRRGITRVKELLAAGVNVTCGQDNVHDSFYPFGQGNMLETAFVLALTAQLTGKEEIEAAFRMIRYNGAKVMGLKDYGIKEGNFATLILLPVQSAADAIALRPDCRLIMKEGRVLLRKDAV